MPRRSLVTSCTSTVVRTWANGKANGNPNGNTRKFSPRQRRATVERTWHQASDATSAVRHLCGSGADGRSAFLTGMLPTEGRSAKFIGRVGAELDVEAGRKAAHLAALNVLAVARQH